MKIYKVWEGILRRAHAHKDQNFHAYENTSVCEEWLNLQTFAKWYQEYRSRLNPESYKELEIDKDIYQWGLVNKIYSPSTCCLIPHRLNAVISGLDLRESTLPVGVIKSKDKYRLEMTINTNRGTVGYYDTVEEAIAAHRSIKKKQILDMGAEYLSMGYITPEVYERLKLLKI